ncbi:MAG TPA: isochorismatase family cysteine hydrolase [bacterium]|nr:isochorismatase family cysteine hydrolase [bacterium]
MKKFLVSICVVFILIFALGGYIFAKFKIMGHISRGTPISVYQNPHEALLIIDLQNDLTDPAGKHPINLQQTDRVITNTNKLINIFNDAGRLIVYIKQIHETGPIVSYFTKGALASGTKGAELDSRVLVRGNNILEKKVMDAFSNPELGKILAKHSVNRLYITGLAADQCIDRTTKAALNRKYDVVVIEDAVIASSDQVVSSKRQEFKSLGVSVLKTDELKLLQ